ncbi:MAG: multiple sugar transport system substrate-binding protein [Thermomicrobiales bacterium]|nr:multiple sugar transport system substrate-binding protein [Thermomicrobiales bacterium]
MAKKRKNRTETGSEGDVLSHRLNRRDLVKTMTFAGGAIVFAGYGPSTYVVAQDQIKISQWYHQYGEEGTEQAVKRYAEEYTKQFPNVVVEVVWQPANYEAGVLPNALLTDKGPDVYESHLSVALVRAGQVEPLDDLYTEEVKADFNPVGLAANTVDGKLYGVKMIDDMGLLYYRKSMLAEKGVNPPTTMEEVIAAAKALDSGRVKGLFLGNDGGIDALHTIGPWSAGSDFVDPATNKMTFDNERTVLAYQKVKELNDSGALLIGAPTDWWDPSALNQGLAAMQWTGLWAMPGIIKALGDDFGVVPWPALDASGKPATFWAGWSEFVNPKGEHKQIQAAKDFVRWLWIERTDLQQDWALSYGFHVPPRKSAAASAEPLKSGPAAEAVTFLNEYGKVMPPQWTAAMDTILITHISNIVKNGADAAAEVTAAAQECQAELDKSLAA